jgi:6,7-dimethyl-8-ribityllumazine synthase
VSDAGFSFDFSSHSGLISTFKIGVAYSLWNTEITQPLFQGCKETLLQYGVTPENMVVLNVPGAFELPLASKQLIETFHCDGVIVLGCVIQGETPHFDFICNGCTDGIMKVMLETSVPIGFGLLTTLNLEQAKDRIGGKHGHKGVEAAETVLQQLVVFSSAQRNH